MTKSEVHLLDVNVLMALAWPNHVHHDLTHRWFAKHRSDGWATTPQTEIGFVRVSSNRSVIPDARTPREAAELLRLIVELAGHVFWNDGVSPVLSESFPWERVVGHRQVADAHLIDLAVRHGGRVATLDQGLLALVAGRQAAATVTLIAA
jgi:toxin-antitoxin system PIN domain toxin